MSRSRQTAHFNTFTMCISSFSLCTGINLLSLTMHRCEVLLCGVVFTYHVNKCDCYPQATDWPNLYWNSFMHFLLFGMTVTCFPASPYSKPLPSKITLMVHKSLILNSNLEYNRQYFHAINRQAYNFCKSQLTQPKYYLTLTLYRKILHPFYNHYFVKIFSFFRPDCSWKALHKTFAITS